MKTKVTTYCGLDCTDCEFKEKYHCKECIVNSGYPFHGGPCEIAVCCQEKKITFCGECPEFPCERLNNFSFDQEHGDNGSRIENCKSIKAAMVAEAREGVDPISICGHHCDYCFLGQRCGSCRSDYNCCSYATLFENKKCPNVICAKDKGLDGCYDCNELEDCKKGYYSIETEYVCKTTALFIKKYGKEIYTQTLKKAINQGENYPKSFDICGSVEKAMALLEKYI